MRALKALVIGMAVVIVIAAAVIAVEIAGRLGGTDGADGVQGPDATAEPAQLDPDVMARDLPVPAGWDIADMTADGNTLVLRLKNAAGDQEVMVVDLSSGAVIRRFAVVPQ